MLKRLMGLETEYMVTSSAVVEDEIIYSALIQAIYTNVQLNPKPKKKVYRNLRRFFTESGGSFDYETLPCKRSGVLCEGSTPECSHPLQLLLYQGVQDDLLINSIIKAERILAKHNIHTKITILKNCRDSFGNTYNAHENYEVPIAKGSTLVLYRMGLAILGLFSLLIFFLVWPLTLLVLVSYLLGGSILEGIASLTRSEESRLRRWSAKYESLGDIIFPFLHRLFNYTILVPLWLPLFALTDKLAFRKIRRDTTAFVITRMIMTGAGTLDKQGNFRISEKAEGLSHRRWNLFTQRQAVFDMSNLWKQLLGLMELRFYGFYTMFYQKQRMQIGFSDSNMAQVAEYLKVGTMAMVLEMAEAGFLEDAPVLKSPMKALQKINEDTFLQTVVDTTNFGDMNAMQIQRFYLDKARKYVQATHITSPEVFNLLELWESVLTDLEHQPEKLFGKVDWITKRTIIEKVHKESDSWLEKKKTDIRYHELGTGYYAALEDDDQTTMIWSSEEIRAAIHRPPEDTPAFVRGRLIQKASEQELRVGWKRAKIGGKVISLDQYRKSKEENI